MGLPARFEIHSHSTVSDGGLRPEELARRMAIADVEVWALTDHDNVSGCARAEKAATAQGMKFISGIEISAVHDGQSIHVLGYGFDRRRPELATYGSRMVEARRQRMEQMIEKVNALGMEMTLEEVIALSPEGNIGRPHLATAMVKRGYCEGEQAAFDRWLSRNGPAYVAMTLLSVEQAIELIVKAGGLVVLAHPARYGDLTPVLKRWKDRGLWGLEVRHPSHGITDENRLLRAAKSIGLGTTASNDWHGTTPAEEKRIGKVRFPAQWREAFLEAMNGTYEGHAS